MTSPALNGAGFSISADLPAPRRLALFRRTGCIIPQMMGIVPQSAKATAKNMQKNRPQSATCFALPR